MRSWPEKGTAIPEYLCTSLEFAHFDVVNFENTLSHTHPTTHTHTYVCTVDHVCCLRIDVCEGGVWDCIACTHITYAHAHTHITYVHTHTHIHTHLTLHITYAYTHTHITYAHIHTHTHTHTIHAHTSDGQNRKSELQGKRTRTCCRFGHIFACPQNWRTYTQQSTTTAWLYQQPYYTYTYKYTNTCIIIQQSNCKKHA